MQGNVAVLNIAGTTGGMVELHDVHGARDERAAAPDYLEHGEAPREDILNDSEEAIERDR